MWLVIWMLRALSDTPSRCVTLIVLLVGHTHNQSERMLSRISVALRGWDYCTVVGMLQRLRESMRTDLHAGHLAQAWPWQGLTEGTRQSPHSACAISM